MSPDHTAPALGIRDAATRRYATAMSKADGSASRAKAGADDSFAASLEFLARSAALDGERFANNNPLRRLPSAR